jgi:hypothetical protein
MPDGAIVTGRPVVMFIANFLKTFSTLGVIYLTPDQSIYEAGVCPEGIARVLRCLKRLPEQLKLDGGQIAGKLLGQLFL